MGIGCGGLRGVACKASQVADNPVKEAQLKKMTSDSGFISALDERGGTSPKTLAAYGITDKDYKDDAEMMSMVHDLRAKIMTSPVYKEGNIIGAILFEDTINRDVEGIPTTQYLWEKKKVVPFCSRILSIVTSRVFPRPSTCGKRKRWSLF